MNKEPKDHLLIIGIMTGNSLDAADAVLTAFHASGAIVDLEFFSLPLPERLFHLLKDLRAAIIAADGDMEAISRNYLYQDAQQTWSFDETLEAYMQFVAQAVAGLRNKAAGNSNIPPQYDISAIDAIGFHGQTCAHKPPSVAGNANDAYTVQIGSGSRLASLTGITTIYDFRSDDLMHGGEGAPLAPMHNRHIAQGLIDSGRFPIAFLNGGNTSNIALVTYDAEKHIAVAGWDAGPFNHLPDALMRREMQLPCDMNGAIGSTGRVNIPLLRQLFEHAATTQCGNNFLLHAPPKSSDPQWYRLVPELTDSALPFPDRLRTAEYFSAYALYHSLGHAPAGLVMPARFAVFGGGWKNPVIYRHFANLLSGSTEHSPVLEEHVAWFSDIRTRMHAQCTPRLAWSDEYGLSGDAMEARIFADMARCLIRSLPFTNKDTTNASAPVIGGIVAYPGGNSANATTNFSAWLTPGKAPAHTDYAWSRAAAGWRKRLIAG